MRNLFFKGGCFVRRERVYRFSDVIVSGGKRFYVCDGCGPLRIILGFVIHRTGCPQLAPGGRLDTG